MGNTWGKWFSKLALRWRETGEAKRDLLAFALLLGYNSSFGALQICDKLAQRQFWKPLGTDLIHDFPLPAVTPTHLLPVKFGQQTLLNLPGLTPISLTHTAQELMVRGELRLSETIVVQGLYAHDFIYRRSYPQAGGVEIEARLGERFRSLSLPVHTLSPEYLQALKLLASQKSGLAPMAA
jgi:hypothetical protein